MTPATLANAYVRDELSRERVRLARADRDAQAASGVGFGGAAPTAPGYRARTLMQIVADAQARESRAERFKASPRGRFLAALRELELHGWAAEAETARAAYRRGFANAELPACPREVGVALAALNPLAGADARDARDCLAELLLAGRRRAA